VEEASLIYVAMTRARDQLVKSSAAQTPFPDKEAPVHPIVASVSKILREKDGISEQVIPPASATDSLTDTPNVSKYPYEPYVFKDTIPYRLLDMYLNCPLRFLYYCVYRLDDGDNTFRQFSKVVSRTMAEIVASARNGEVLSRNQIQEKFTARWQKIAGDREEHPVFVTRALEALFHFRERVLTDHRMEIRYEAIFLVEGRRISLLLDEVSHNGSRWTVRRRHLSKPSDEHKKAKFFLALQLANEERELRSPLILLDYPVEERQIPLSPPRGDRVAEHRRQLAEAITAIEAGKFPARPSGYKCRTCPYFLSCRCE
jgi:CRISPR/Cas system-associated exonuclease Cas4 (RecB family)